ncbi:MAG: PAS domain S-box protein [Tenericutes bacterium HGW-Tenericutes-8]|nr:MAG: PAS domain S-box protein [Tenericutes bacterium HGW-Tenericutes-8]
MSEFINNVSQKRQEKLKEIILSLHNGATLEEAKKVFKAHFEDVTTKEITEMEQSLMKEGMQVGEVQRLCDVHAAVFEGSISDIHSLSDHNSIPGHPVRIFKQENERIVQLIETEIEPYLSENGKSADLMLRVGYDRLKAIHNHYARKEYLFFPKLEKVGITAPPKVMWGVDDEIRAEIKDILNDLGSIEQNESKTREKIKTNIAKIKDMVFKEDNILMPMLLEHMTFFDWVLVDSSSEEMGYFLEKPTESWKQETKPETEKIQPFTPKTDGEVPFDAGSLTFEQVNQMLNTLPFDMTFVDHEGHVKYFTQGKERIFDRPKTIIGRHVSMCHPPQSVHVVEEIVESFRSGKKDNEDFWIKLKDIFVYIRYFAVRSKDGQFLGTLEITQNIKPIRELEGEKRLVSKD